MGKGHRYQRSSSSTPFGSHNSSYRKKNFSPRNLPTPFHAPHDIGHFDGRPNSRFGFDSSVPPGPPFGGWYPRHGRPAGNVGIPPLRPFDTTPPAMPYDFPQPQTFYPPMPYVDERGPNGPFRRSTEGFQDLQNKLFLDEYRFPGPHQAYETPHIEAFPQASVEQAGSGENSCEFRKPLTRNNKLRGDAPEFVPRGKCAVSEKSGSKMKEPCWLVVSG